MSFQNIAFRPARYFSASSGLWRIYDHTYANDNTDNLHVLFSRDWPQGYTSKDSANESKTWERCTTPGKSVSCIRWEKFSDRGIGMSVVSLVKWNSRVSELVDKTWSGDKNKECKQNQVIVLVCEALVTPPSSQKCSCSTGRSLHHEGLDNFTGYAACNPQYGWSMCFRTPRSGPYSLGLVSLYLLILPTARISFDVSFQSPVCNGPLRGCHSNEYTSIRTLSRFGNYCAKSKGINCDHKAQQRIADLGPDERHATWVYRSNRHLHNPYLILPRHLTFSGSLSRRWPRHIPSPISRMPISMNSNFRR